MHEGRVSRPLTPVAGAPERAPEARDAADLVRRERERIACELHEVLLERLSRLGFDLSALIGQVHGPAEDRIVRAVGEIDQLLRLTRQVVFGLLAGRSRGSSGLAALVELIVADAAVRVGCPPRLQVHGDLTALPPPLVRPLQAVLLEAVSNVVAHAEAHSFEVRIDVDAEGGVELTVVDDGVGPPPAPSGGLGLRDMAALAEDRDGRFYFGPAAVRGTRVHWAVPAPRLSPAGSCQRD